MIASTTRAVPLAGFEKRMPPFSANSLRPLRPTSPRELENFRKEINFLRALQGPAPATRGLLTLIAAVFLGAYLLNWSVVTPRVGAPADPLLPMLLVGAKINTEIAAGAWWRLLSAAFVHGSWLHALVNAYGLFMLGGVVERLFGTRRFLLIYAVAALCGGLASYAFNTHPSVGASGAIFGVFGAAIVFGFRHRSSLPAHIAKALSVGMLPWLVFSLAFGLLPMIDNAAHLGGLAGGAALAAVLGTPLQGQESHRFATLQNIALALCAAVIITVFFSAARYTYNCTNDPAAWEQCVEAAGFFETEASPKP